MFNILDIFFPRSNKNFSSISEYLNKNEISRLKPKLKPLTKNQRKYLEMIYIASPYNDEIIQDLINRVKFKHETAIIKDFAKLIYQKIYDEADYFIPTPDIIIPVASDPKRELIRGYSLQHLLSKELSELTKANYQDVLTKQKTTPQQTSLERKSRLTNLKNTITVDNSEPYSNIEVVWLVDDICTTGTTLSENAKQIKKAYPFLKIYGVTVAGN
jgi:ComF family protein